MGDVTAKRETGEKRERMMGECHIFSSSAPGARPLEDNAHAAHNTQDNKGGMRTRKREAGDSNERRDKKIKL